MEIWWGVIKLITSHIHYYIYTRWEVNTSKPSKNIKIVTLRKIIVEIGQYWCENVRILNCILNLHSILTGQLVGIVLVQLRLLHICKCIEFKLIIIINFGNPQRDVAERDSARSTQQHDSTDSGLDRPKCCSEFNLYSIFRRFKRIPDGGMSIVQTGTDVVCKLQCKIASLKVLYSNVSSTSLL